jgi:glycosyltransferase involved in cell wall biosynthesis
LSRDRARQAVGSGSPTPLRPDPRYRREWGVALPRAGPGTLDVLRVSDTRPDSAGLVLHVVSSGGIYGIERVLLSLLPALGRLGRCAGLGCMGEPGTAGGRVGQAAADLGIPVWYAGDTGRLSPRGMLRLHRAIASSRPQLLHLHGYKATILAGTLCLVRGMQAVATYHAEASQALDQPRLPLYLPIETQVLRRLRGVIAVSEPIQRELLRRRVPKERVAVIPNGIELGAERREDLDTWLSPNFSPLLLAVGRLVPEKNIGLALDVLERLRVHYPTAGLVLAGEGPLRSVLEEKASALGLSECVRFLGFVDNVRGLLSRCDCFLLPSSTEGMPIALLEAMSAGAPIVASGVGGIPFAIADGTEGLLVPPGDGDRLFDAVRRVLENPGLRATLTAAARTRFTSEFTAHRMAERYARFYDSVLAGD